MGKKRSPVYRILESLWVKPASDSELAESLGLSEDEVSAACLELLNSKLLTVDTEERWKIRIIHGRGKLLILDSLDELLELAKKRINSARGFARYKTYEGEAGSEENWRAAAEAMRGITSNKVDEIQQAKVLLSIAGELTAQSLSKGYRKAMKTAHPDVGGSHEAALAVQAAYELLGRGIN